jgi:hypothetical protein
MEIRAILPNRSRDLRLDLFRGIANWAIFLNHMPENAVNWITNRNYGFSDAADLFVFISGYTVSLVYARMMLDHGFIVGATRLFKRVWQLYVAYIVLFVLYLVSIGSAALYFNNSEILHEFNAAGLVNHPLEILSRGLLLQFKPLNLEVLPLYIVLMAAFPGVLWLMLRKPDLVMLLSLALYLAARLFGWNLPAYPAAVWYFNPFAWQLLFVFGCWCALGGVAGARAEILRLPALIYLGTAYLLFALVITMAGRFPDFGNEFPKWLLDAFNPNDKTNLAPYRFLHFVVLAFLVTRALPKDWPGLKSKILAPAIKCGQQSLPVFCVGVLLSFVGHFALMLSSGSLTVQVLVASVGITIMIAVAYYVSWSKKQDRAVKGPPAVPSVKGSAS